MCWQGRRESNNVEDCRDQSPAYGGGRQIRIPRSKGGIILLVVVAVAGYYGYDLTGLLTGGDVALTSQQQRVSANDDEAAKFTRVILASTEDTWGKLFQNMGKEYVAPTLVMYRGATQTRCGIGKTAMGPFYCPEDQRVYIDLSFYDEMKTKLGAGGDLQQALDAAQAIGDDRLQQRSQGRVVPDSFTHGTSEQRYTWFKRGFDSGDPGQCNTFAAN